MKFSGSKIKQEKGCAYETHTRNTSAGRALRFSPFFTPFARFLEGLTNGHSVCILGSQNAFSGYVGDNFTENREKQRIIMETDKKEVIIGE